MTRLERSSYKRLIVCCDGTWQDSTADSADPPSNVTRLSRTLSQTAIVEENGVRKEVPQIVYYQKGVGTGLGDKYMGGVTGLGVSANVRAAYGFLTDNYTEGDEIFFFGFSRGAYTARAIAGLVCRWGLLTHRGMDNFTNVYDDFYEKQVPDYTPEERRRLGFREELPPFTVKIIGVWDTVGFQKAWLGKDLGERLELRNTYLLPNVKYAFHALALDEERTAYSPILWHVPRPNPGQELLQVWFSGVHTDVGGGGKDPHLANISLAWMIAQCMKDGQLSFDIDEYLFDVPPRVAESDLAPWATSQGKSDTASLVRTLEGVFGGTSHRTPLGYNPKGEEGDFTGEYIHESINGRKLRGWSWPCAPLKGKRENGTWTLADSKTILEIRALERERYMKGRIRTVHVEEVD
ncbi:T6SS phospholipase effector Tle1-like catalytic domain-containing protein [Aspergillus brunneoviolaceus CBS 621.78]|uniref:Uncharacterized protein n=1 Tax=Aspergillus brunneoviolaceus CBS 621.78 TaxID=1450534 RepID=A0ACD1G500_9EURO|nr:hypothetical protein BO95DRAFT_392499 [Aspergillus brunneoviolaceus CBS 621.78]RAH44257.1 hypothetical protein BO95DRAFT_392499 [Aspergillus brunneoviolaceus CBS 621.78]